jgi:hypothetical protein
MPSLFTRPVAMVLTAVLALLLIVRGVVPALSRIDSDFLNYLTAAKIVVDGGDVGRLYDDAWFQQQLSHFAPGVAVQGKFSPFPPPTALLLVPLSALSPLAALRVVTAISVLCVIAAIALLARILTWAAADAAVLVLSSGYTIANGLRLGQPYMLVSLGCVFGYYAWRTARPLLAGLSLGVFVPIKFFPVIIVACLGYLRQWRVLAGAAIAVAGVALLSIGVLGLDIHRQYLVSVFGQHLTAHLSGQDPFSVSFQSWDSLYRRLFVWDAVLNPHPWRMQAAAAPIATVLTKAALALLTLAAIVQLRRLHRNDAEGWAAPSIGLLGIAALLLAPATASYHFVLLWLPVALLVDYFLRARRRVAAFGVLGLYALIGFFPYRFTVPFEGRGGLSLLAYPRLALLLAMLLGSVVAIGSCRGDAPGQA